ncbi:MAG: AI-2E family transporter [Butyrivibrio sp.]|nr:AI-2E family transporter [Butyrivibrio sp.]
MQMKPEKNQITWAVTIFFLSIAIMLAYSTIFNSKSFLSTLSRIVDSLSGIIIGLVIAFLLVPLLDGIETKILIPIYKKRGIDVSRSIHANEKKRKQVRKISVSLTMIIFLLAIYGLFRVIIPQLINSVREIVRNFPIYLDNIDTYTESWYTANVSKDVESIMQQIGASAESLSIFLSQKLMPLVPEVDTIVKVASQSLFSFFNVFLDIIVGIIVAINVLASKEKFSTGGKKLAYALFREEVANEIVGGFRFIGNTFEAFVGGKLVDSLIIGVICYIGCVVMKINYPVLISVIVGVTNIIPFFGPYIGGGAGALLLVLISPVKALIFLVFVIILQQFDGNILGPRILGDSTGLSSFWVLFAITFFGGIWGIVGWLVGVPIFAVIYAFVSRLTNILLHKKGLSTRTTDYNDLAYIENKEFKTLSDEHNVKYNAHSETGTIKRLFKLDSNSKNKGLRKTDHPEETEKKDEKK